MEAITAVGVDPAPTAAARGLAAGAGRADHAVGALIVADAAIACAGVRRAVSGRRIAVHAVDAVGVGHAAGSSAACLLASAGDTGQILAAVAVGDTPAASRHIGCARAAVDGTVTVEAVAAVGVDRALAAAARGLRTDATDTREAVGAVHVSQAAAGRPDIGSAGRGGRIAVEAVGAVGRDRAAVATRAAGHAGAVDAGQVFGAVGVRHAVARRADVRDALAEPAHDRPTREGTVKPIGAVGVDNAPVATTARWGACRVDAGEVLGAVAVAQATLARGLLRNALADRLVAGEAVSAVAVHGASVARAARRRTRPRRADQIVSAVAVHRTAVALASVRCAGPAGLVAVRASRTVSVHRAAVAGPSGLAAGSASTHQVTGAVVVLEAAVAARRVGHAGARGLVTVGAGRAVAVHGALVAVASRWRAQPVETGQPVLALDRRGAAAALGDVRSAGPVRGAVQPIGAVGLRDAAAAGAADGGAGAALAGEILGAVAVGDAAAALTGIRRALARRLIAVQPIRAVGVHRARIAAASHRHALAGDACQVLATLGVGQAAAAHADVGHALARDTVPREEVTVEIIDTVRVGQARAVAAARPLGNAGARRRVACEPIGAVAIGDAAVAAAAGGDALRRDARQILGAVAVLDTASAAPDIRGALAGRVVAVQSVRAIRVHDAAVATATDRVAAARDAGQVFSAVAVGDAVASASDIGHAQTGARREAAVQPVGAVRVLQAPVVGTAGRPAAARRVTDQLAGTVTVHHAATAPGHIGHAAGCRLIAVVAVGAVGVHDAPVAAASSVGARARDADELARALAVAEAAFAAARVGRALPRRRVAVEVRAAVSVHGAAIAAAAHRLTDAADAGGPRHAVPVDQAGAAAGCVRHAGRGRLVTVEPVSAVAVRRAAVAATADRGTDPIDAGQSVGTVGIAATTLAGASCGDAHAGRLIALEPVATVAVHGALVAAAAEVGARAADAGQPVRALGVVGAAVAGAAIRRADASVAEEAGAAVHVQHASVAAAADREADAIRAGQALGAVRRVHAAAARALVGRAGARRHVAVEADGAVGVEHAAIATTAGRPARPGVTDEVRPALGVRHTVIARPGIGHAGGRGRITVVTVEAVGVDGTPVAAAARRGALACDTRQVAGAVRLLDAAVPVTPVRSAGAADLVTVEAVGAVALDDAAVAAATRLDADAGKVADQGASAVRVLDTAPARRGVRHALTGDLVAVVAVSAVALEDAAVAGAAGFATRSTGAYQCVDAVSVVVAAPAGRGIGRARPSRLVAVVAVSAVGVDQAPVAAAAGLSARAGLTHQLARAVGVLDAVGAAG